MIKCDSAGHVSIAMLSKRSASSCAPVLVSGTSVISGNSIRSEARSHHGRFEMTATWVFVVALVMMTASPALCAKPKKEVPVPKPICRTVEDAKKSLIKVSAVVEHELTGDDLKKLNDVVEKKGGSPPPDGMDALIVFSLPDVSLWTGAIFIKGCLDQIIPISPESFKKLLALSKDDGSI